MALQRIQPGSLQTLSDPVCAVRNDEVLTDFHYNPKSYRTTEPGKWFEDRRVNFVYSHCVEKDHEHGQQDDNVTNARWPVPDGGLKPKQGGPIWTDKKHR